MGKKKKYKMSNSFEALLGPNTKQFWLYDGNEYDSETNI